MPSNNSNNNNNKVTTGDLEKLIGERDYLKREVNRLEDEVSRIIATKHESDQLCYLLLNEKESLTSAYSDLQTAYSSAQSELTSLRNALAHLQTCNGKMTNGEQHCGQSHPDLMEMLRSNSDSSLAASSNNFCKNQSSQFHEYGLIKNAKNILNQVKCYSTVSTQTEATTIAYDSMLVLPTTTMDRRTLEHFPEHWSYEQLPPPPSPCEIATSDSFNSSSNLIEADSSSSTHQPINIQSTTGSQHQTLQSGINQLLLAHALGQLNDNDDIEDDDDDDDGLQDEDEEDDDDDDYEDDDILQECDAIEYENVSLTRNSPNQSLGLCLSSDPPTSSQLTSEENDQNQQKHFQKVYHSQGNSSSLPFSSSFDCNQGNGNKVEVQEQLDSQQQSKVNNNKPDDESDNINKRSEVYISLLEPGGLAERSGSIKIGDQILEINGSEVTNLDEAKSILSRRDISSFILLIGRPNVNHDHSKCCERSLAKRLALFESSDVNHVAIVDCSQEFYILSIDSKGKPASGNNYTLASLVNGQGNRVIPGVSNGIYETYAALGKDEKDSGMGKTDGDSTCSRTNDTCSTDHELTGSDKVRTNDSLSGSHGLHFSGQGSASYSSENSLEKRRQLIQRDMNNSNQQYQSEKFNQQTTIPETSPYSEIDDKKNNNDNGQPRNNGTELYDEECHYASTEIVSTPNQPPKNIFKPKPSPPKISPKPIPNNNTNGTKLPTSKSGADLLPEMHPSEKKESIKRWIKSGLPTATVPLPPTSSVTNMSNRPSSFKPGLIPKSPMESRNLQEQPDEGINNIPKDFNSKSSNTSMNQRQETKKEDKGIVTEEKGTQIESDAASLMSCESCRMCCKSLKPSDDKGVQQYCETFQPHTVQFSRPMSISTSGMGENKRSGNLPIPVKVPIVPDLSLGNVINKSVSKNLREEKENIYSTLGPTTTMYTTKANLEHTIKLQQEMLRQAMIQQQKLKPSKHQVKGSESNESSIHHNSLGNYHHRSNVPFSSHVDNRSSMVHSPSSMVPPTNPSKYFHHLGRMVHSSSLAKFKDKLSSSHLIHGHPNGGYNKDDFNRNGKEVKTDDGLNNSVNNVNMEWKVKKRPDGTRYITRKPIRSKILKERAQIINQERLGLTTDDDAMSELKVGRYWSRNERKKHCEKAKDRKRKEMLLRKIKMSSVREHSEERESISNNKGIKFVELTSHHGVSGGGCAGNHSSSGSSGSIAKNRAVRGSIKGCVINGNVVIDKSIHSLIKQSAGIVTSSSHGHGVKLNGPMNRAPSKNQINELLTVTTV